MKRVLIVAYFFPPIAASGSFRPLGFCRYVERYGWSPSVLTTEPASVYPPLTVDENLCSGLPKAVKIYRVPAINPLQLLIHARVKLRKRVRDLLGNRNHQLAVGHDLPKPRKSGLHRQVSALKNSALDWLFSFPDPYCSWLRPAVHRLSRIPPSERPDAVFATGGPWTSLLVGKALAEKFGVPFVADLRDPWTPWGVNPLYADNGSFLFRKFRQAERSVYAAAAQVITTTKELQTKLLTDYPDLDGKCVAITNGFDSEAWQSVVDLQEGRELVQPAAPDKNVLELCHFGTVYGNRNPLPLLRAVKELVDEGRIERDRLRIRFIGAWEVTDNSCETLARELETQGFMRREPVVPHEVCLRQMVSAKVLLILQPDYPLSIPAKIYEYIATGRPLLVIGGEGATARLVERHRLGRCCPNTTPEIKELLRHLITGRTQIETPRRADTAAFDYRVLAGKLACVLDKVCAERAR
jgi:glycosyltransferase involved in cell wall biosynthesis